MRFNRALIGVVAAVATLVALAPAAAALTISPWGPAYTANSGPATFRFTSNGQSISCTSTSVTWWMNASGTGTVSTVGDVHSGCRSTLLGTFTVDHVAQFSINTTLSPSYVAIGVTIPAGRLQFTGSGCTFTVGGTYDIVHPLFGLPTTITSGISVGRSSLTVTGNNGGPVCGFFPVGLAVSYSATYSLTTSMTVSG